MSLGALIKNEVVKSLLITDGFIIMDRNTFN